MSLLAMGDSLTRCPNFWGQLSLMPNLAEVYATKVAALADSLNDPEIKAEATELIRQLIGRVVMTPDPDAPDGMRMEVHGILGEIVALAAGQELKSKLPDLGGPGSQLSVVAGARIGLYRTRITPAYPSPQQHR